MYPNLYYLFKDLFGIDVRGLKIVNTFGFIVAICFLVAAWLLIKELKRKQAGGAFTYTETKITIGKPASFSELLLNFFLGFLLGYKLIGVFITEGALNDAQGFIFSGNGNLPAGIIIGLLFAFLKWREKNKLKLAKPEERTVRIWPSDKVGDIVIISAVAGFIGAKIFDNLENWDRFIQDPVGNLISPSGLTFYGGLIVASLALWYYFRRNNIRFLHMADANAPSLMFAYAFGRAGCQVAGDGDWGILNSAYLSNSQGQVVPGSAEQFNNVLQSNSSFYVQQFGSLNEVQHAAAKSFWGLPNWLFAYAYPHNVNKEGIPIIGCTWDDYCNHLPLPVFPTPLYEITIGLLLFAFLWGIRKKITVPGRMFSIYLIVTGIERFIIEQIRVNTKYTGLPFQPTQAELISCILIIAGIVLYWYAPRLKFASYKTADNT